LELTIYYLSYKGKYSIFKQKFYNRLSPTYISHIKIPKTSIIQNLKLNIEKMTKNIIRFSSSLGFGTLHLY